jgi:hypothetical protein
MAVFLHPHLTRGVVKTAKGAFVITRGFVSVPDEVGESLGWTRVESEAHLSPEPSVAAGGPSDSRTRRDAAALESQ